MKNKCNCSKLFDLALEVVHRTNKQFFLHKSERRPLLNSRKLRTKQLIGFYLFCFNMSTPSASAAAQGAAIGLRHLRRLHSGLECSQAWCAAPELAGTYSSEARAWVRNGISPVEAPAVGPAEIIALLAEENLLGAKFKTINANAQYVPTLITCSSYGIVEISCFDSQAYEKKTFYRRVLVRFLKGTWAIHEDDLILMPLSPSSESAAQCQEEVDGNGKDS